MSTTEIPLSRGCVAIIDGADLARVLATGPWHAAPSRTTMYARHNVRREGGGGWRTEGLHAFLLGHPGVDHVNGDGLDNRRANLRPASAALNAANRRRRGDSSSGFKGVTANRIRGLPWRAQICVNYQKRHLGLFSTAEEAALAYDAAALDAWGPYARLNFPQERAS